MGMRPGVIAAAAIGFLLAGAGPAMAQTAADLFDQNTIQEIRLSVNTRDLTVVQASVMAVSVFFVLANLAVDLIASRLDPRYELR